MSELIETSEAQLRQIVPVVKQCSRPSVKAFLVPWDVDFDC